MWDKDPNDMEDMSENGKWGVWPAWVGLETRISLILPPRLGVIPAMSGIVNWLAHEILHIPVSDIDIPSPLSSISFSSSTLPSPTNLKVSHPCLSLHTMIMTLHRVPHTLSTAYSEYCMISRLTVSPSQPVSHRSSVCRSCCTHISIVARSRVNQSIEFLLPWRLYPDLHSPDQPPASTPSISMDHGLNVHLHTRSMAASKFAQQWPPCGSPTSLNQCL